MNTKQRITRSIVIFASLTICGFIVAFNAQIVPEAFAQTVMVSIGGAIFCAGLTFFLIRMVTLMDK